MSEQNGSARVRGDEEQASASARPEGQEAEQVRMSELAESSPSLAEPKLVPSPRNGVIPPVHSRYKPGAEWKGNRKGRGVMDRALRAALKAAPQTKAEMALAALKLAKMGDMTAWREVRDTLDGRPSTRTEMTVEHKGGFTVTHAQVAWGEDDSP